MAISKKQTNKHTVKTILHKHTLWRKEIDNPLVSNGSLIKSLLIPQNVCMVEHNLEVSD